mmetsp:Transcript_149164/g.362263  ORF Transcript_149164/g.362263 Transcript_149164/m.362263 type:complete len:468 (-) Transcript_149164:229-1632(-)
MKHKTKVRGQERKPVALFSRPGPARWAAHRALYPLLAPRHAEEGDHLGPAPCARGLHHLGRPLRVRHLGCTLPSGLTAWTLHLGVGEVAVRAPVDTDRAAIGEVASEAALCHRGLDVGDDGALDGPGAESGVVAALCNDVHGLGGHVQRDGPLLQALLDPNQLQLRDLLEVCSPEGAEGDRLVDAVEELRPEEGLHLLMDEVLHPRIGLLLLVVLRAKAHAESARGALLDRATAQVRGHDHQGVGEGDRPALGVGHPAVVQQLQQQVEDVGVRLLHLIKEHQGVGPSAHGLCEGAAIAVADIAGGCADELGDGVLLHVLAHVQPDHRVLLPEVRRRQSLAQLGLANTCGTAEDEGRDRPVRVLQAGPRTADRLGHGRDGLLLANDALVECLLQRHQPCALVRGHLLHGHARPRRHHLRHIALRDDRLLHVQAVGFLVLLLLLLLSLLLLSLLLHGRRFRLRAFGLAA